MKKVGLYGLVVIASLNCALIVGLRILRLKGLYKPAARTNQRLLQYTLGEFRNARQKS